MRNANSTTISVPSTEKIRSGEKVFVKLHDGTTAERYVWDVYGDNVFVCTERVYKALSSGLEAPTPIGFPLSDIIYSTA